MRIKALAAGLLIFLVACSPTEPRTAMPPAGIDETAQRVAAAAGDRSPHGVAAALVDWLQKSMTRQAALDQPNAERAFEQRTAGPAGFAALFARMLAAVGIPYRVYLVLETPASPFYPLIEVTDADGDHLWDPYTGRFSPDYDGTPLGYPAAFRHASAVTDAAGSPGWASLGALPALRLKPDRTAIVPVPVDLTYADVAFGRPDGYADDLRAAAAPALAALGEQRDDWGTYSLAAGFQLSGLEPGRRYRLHIDTLGAPVTAVVSAPLSFSSQSHRRLERSLEYTFAASATTATLTLGALEGETLRVDALHWSRL